MARKNQFLAERLFTPRPSEQSPMQLRKKDRNNSNNDNKSGQKKMAGKGGKDMVNIKKPTSVSFKPILW
jgi:hypothetical protein